MPDDGEDCGAVVLPDPAVVFLKRDVENPVEAVLDLPVRAYGAGEAGRVERQGREEVPRPRPGLAAVDPDKDEAADAGRLLPSGVTLPGQPMASHRVNVRGSAAPLPPPMV